MNCKKCGEKLPKNSERDFCFYCLNDWLRRQLFTDAMNSVIETIVGK
jgi:hypothetical protein